MNEEAMLQVVMSAVRILLPGWWNALEKEVGEWS
jgi:hypothetical protein